MPLFRRRDHEHEYDRQLIRQQMAQLSPLNQIGGTLTANSNSDATGSNSNNDATSIPEKPKHVAVAIRESTPEIESLAKKAKEVLGYMVLEYDLSTKLAETLKGLDIEILDREQVDDYKQALEVTQRGALIGRESKWEKFHIDMYPRPIPEHVLNKAIQIKERLPSVDFFVDELRSNRIPDPFLLVKLGREEYYIEVWDEPKFEGRITKEE